MANVAFIPVHAGSEAAMGAVECTLASEHAIILFCSRDKAPFPQLLTEGYGEGHDAGHATELETKIIHAHELGVVSGEPGTNSSMF